MNGALAIGLTFFISPLCTDSLRTSLYCIDVAAFNLGTLWLVGMNLGFLLGVNDHWLVIHLFYLQCSHLLSSSITTKWVKK